MADPKPAGGSAPENVSTGEIPSGAPDDLNAPGSVRVIMNRLNEMDGRIAGISHPPGLRLGDALTIGAFLLAILTFVATSINLNGRLSDLENRLGARVGEVETRLTNKLDQMTDQQTKQDERLSRLEGAQSQKPLR